MANRIILHIDMDAFFAQVEERENPQFKGKPIVVGADPKDGKGRGVVSTANYEARKYGIHSALPISRAYKLCPTAVFLPVNMLLYEKVSEKIMAILRQYSPICEQTSLDEAYLDIFFVKNYQKAELLAKKLKSEILKKEKLVCTIGIGPNKLIAKMATNKAKPDGLLVIKPNQIQKFLEPLDIQELPGVGPKTAQKLRIIDINTIKELKKLNNSELKEKFGRVGELIYEKTRGIDDSLVVTEEIVKSMGKEHTFEKDTRDSEIIFTEFEKLVAEVHKELFSGKFLFKTVTVICRFTGFETHTKSKTLDNQSSNLGILNKTAKRLLLKFLVENPKPIRLIGLRVKIC